MPSNNNPNLNFDINQITLYDSIQYVIYHILDTSYFLVKEQMILVLKTADDVQAIKNTFFDSNYNDEELTYFTNQEIEKVLNFQKTNEQFTETPLIHLKALSQELNVKNIYVKDESTRCGLNAIKVMGGVYE